MKRISAISRVLHGWQAVPSFSGPSATVDVVDSQRFNLGAMGAAQQRTGDMDECTNAQRAG